MQAILPGRPQAQLQAIATGSWEDQTVIAYISGTALVICNGPDSLIQTIYHDEVSPTTGLVAVAYDHRSAKLATACADQVFVYVLREEIKGQLRWFLDMTFDINQEKGREESRICTLSWSLDEELLVASDKLSLLSTQSHSTVWTRTLPSPVSHAVLSPSAALLATTSHYDRLVKIWRRLSFESATFDYAYLTHPDIVTHLEWRSSEGQEDVLYTICLDGRLRVWKTGPPRQKGILALYAELDLFAAVQPLVPSQRRYAYLVPASVFSKAVEHATSTKPPASERHAVEYMKELANRNPDIVVVIDDQGHMSAWGLENVGCKRRQSVIEHDEFFHAAHVENLLFDFPIQVDPFEDNARIINFPLFKQPGQIGILIHYFDGRIQWWQGSVHHVFDPSPRKQRMTNLATWTGHSSSIKKLIRTANGSAVISRTDTNEGVVWKHRDGGLVRKSKIKLQHHIHRTTLLRDGDFIAILHHENLTLWDAREFNAKDISTCPYSVSGKPLCLLLLPSPEGSNNLSYLATVTKDMHGIVWELDLGSSSPSMSQFCTFQLDPIQNMSYFLPVDPSGSSPVVSGFLDTFSQDVAVSWTTTGILQTWTARIDRNAKSVTWLNISTTDTSIQNPSLGSGTSIRKAALVDKSRSTLTIWDTKSGRLDYQETFDNQTIVDLDWASTPDNQSILAVGFPHAIFVYTQLRYDYVSENPSWSRIKEVTTRYLSPHPIGDSVWLGSGNLVVGAGNQLYLVGNQIDPSKDLSPDLQSSTPHKSSNKISDVVRRLNGPLPVFHPQFISQCILAGKTDIVHRILLNLQKTLKFYTEGDDLDSFQGLDISDFMSSSETGKGSHNAYNTRGNMDQEVTAVDEDVATSIVSLLAEKSIPQLSSTEQLTLADIVECVGIVEKHRRSIDANAARFLLFWRETLLRSRQANVASSNTAVTWREMLWAYYSSSQDILVDLITRHNNGQLSWSHARDTGIFVWLTDREALLQNFEAVARSAYTSTELKDPVNCTLYYIALRKKNVLLGLWRMATWSREQAATSKLLKNDFTDPRWRTAANKNAYALMGRRRFEYAAAFFLLADNLDSAVSVLSNQLGDVQLAIAVARVYGGDDSPSLVKLLTERVLPTAAQEGNRCQSTWCYWMLGKRSLAVRSLVSPLHSLLNPPGSPPDSLRAKSFLNDDPALVVLYQQLREKSLQTLKGALMISGKEEWQFVTKSAALLLRMGCDIIALDLVRHWEFLRQQTPAKQENEEEGEEEAVADLPTRKLSRAAEDMPVDPRKLLRRRSSLVVADLPEGRPKVKGGEVSSMLDGWGAPAPTLQKAPKSLLDDFTPAPQAQKAPKSMLDDFAAPAPKVAPKSMLDDFTSAPQAQKAPKSMLDDFTSAPESKAPPKNMLDGFNSAPTAQKAPKSMLDDFTSAPTSQKAPKSMLDDFTSDSPTKKAPKSMLDDFTSSPSTQKAPKSMLEDFTTPTPKAGAQKPTPSMLDQWEMPERPKQAPKPAPSMLDDWTEPEPKPKTVASKLAPSMLDEWSAPPVQPKAAAKSTPSMLDQWTSPSSTTKPMDGAKDGTEANKDEGIPAVGEKNRQGKKDKEVKEDGVQQDDKNDAEVEKQEEDKKEKEEEDKKEKEEEDKKEKEEDRKETEEKDKKEAGEKNGKEKEEKNKKPAPTQFKEPDPNSLLDAFGF